MPKASVPFFEQYNDICRLWLRYPRNTRIRIMFPKRSYTTVMYSGEFPFNRRWSEDFHSSSPSTTGKNCGIRSWTAQPRRFGDRSVKNAVVNGGDGYSRPWANLSCPNSAVLFASPDNLLKCRSATRGSVAILGDQAVFGGNPKVECL